jgi:hypothetical protein
VSVASIALVASACSQASSSAQPSCPGGEDPVCPATPPSYTTDIAPIVQADCLQCHSPGGVESSQRLDSYQALYDLRLTAEGQLKGCLMPNDGGPTMTAQDRATFLAWIACGAPGPASDAGAE